MKPLPTPETNPVAKKRKARIIKHAEYLWIDETAITTASESVKGKKKDGRLNTKIRKDIEGES
jgi:hypothetical protein